MVGLDREYAVVSGVVRLPRFAPFVLKDEVREKSTRRSGTVQKRAIGKPGLLESLHWVETGPNELEDDQVELEPRAVGLNFRVCASRLLFQSLTNLS